MLARCRSLRSRDEQAGFTLVEILVTVTIMGLAFVVILGAIGVFFSSTRVHRSSADLDAAMRTYVEKLNAAPYATACPAGYGGVAAPSGFTVAVQVDYWDGIPSPTGWGPDCAAATGAQRLTVTLKQSSTGQSDSLVVVKRKA
jgi:prepilin-type N-terminal cleavage/methylation domain-containing protein